MAERPGPHGSFAWRVLRRVLPRAYRDAWGDDVLQAHIDAQRASGNERGARFWRRVAGDVVMTSMRLRLDEWRDRQTPNRARVNVLDLLRYNLRLSARGLAHSPGFTVAVVLTLALGLGANATIFTVLDRLLLSPPDHVIR